MCIRDRGSTPLRDASLLKAHISGLFYFIILLILELFHIEQAFQKESQIRKQIKYLNLFFLLFIRRPGCATGWSSSAYSVVITIDYCDCPTGYAGVQQSVDHPICIVVR